LNGSIDTSVVFPIEGEFFGFFRRKTTFRTAHGVESNFERQPELRYDLLLQFFDDLYPPVRTFSVRKSKALLCFRGET
jgi:hypothetical protein